MQRLLIAVCLLAPACGEDLGECDRAAAQQLVYGQNGVVATKGQALMHESCGGAAFCHSASAAGKNRFGAPGDMNFDMLPRPTGWPEAIEHRDDIWKVVLDGSMPPRELAKRTVSAGQWSFDREHAPGTTVLPALTTREGKAALRNWLACDAPVVADTRVPSWALPPSPDGGVADSDWNDIFQAIVMPRCATAGCHDSPAAGQLVLVDECQAYQQLLADGPCGGMPRLLPGDADSYLLDKLEAKTPRCGAAMPPSGQLPGIELGAIRRWVEAGAPAQNCQ
jgi:hypothetical protein